MLYLETLTEQKTNDGQEASQKLSKDMMEYLAEDPQHIDELKEYVGALEELNENSAGRIRHLSNFRFYTNALAALIAIFLSVYIANFELGKIKIGKDGAAILGSITAACLIYWVSAQNFHQLSTLNTFTSHNQAFTIFAKRILEAESEDDTNS